MREKLKKIRKSRIFNLFLILIFIAVCIGAGVLGAYIEHESDPTDQAAEYFRAFVQGDYDKMYGSLTIKDGYYISRSMYKSQMQRVRESMTIDTYDIKEPTKIDGGKQVVMECINTETEESRSFIVKLTESGKHNLIIPEYEINIDEMLVRDFSVTINKGDYLELNGEKVESPAAEITTDNDGNTVYKMKALINGKYKISSINKYASMNKNVKLNQDGKEVSLTGKNYTSNDAYEKKLTKSSEKVIGQFYKAVRNRKPSSKKLLACFDNNKKLIQKVKTYVEESEEIVYWPDKKNIANYNVIQMNMSKLKHTTEYNTKKKQFTLVYTYNYSYVSSTDTALYNSYVYSLSGKCKSTMTLTYSLKKDKIVLTNIKIKNSNKKN